MLDFEYRMQNVIADLQVIPQCIRDRTLRLSYLSAQALHPLAAYNVS
jgi:hypothetical protein